MTTINTNVRNTVNRVKSTVKDNAMWVAVGYGAGMTTALVIVTSIMKRRIS